MSIVCSLQAYINGKGMEWRNGPVAAPAVKQALFFRDALPKALCASLDEHLRWDGSLVVIGEHTSKSVVLPVVQGQVSVEKWPSAKVTLTMRDNFDDVVVSVECEGDAFFDKLPRSHLWDNNLAVDEHSAHCDGIPEHLVFGNLKDSWEKTPQRFTLRLRDKYSLFAFANALRNTIDCWDRS